MQVSQIVRENLEIDSQSFKDLSPLMKEAVSDVFKLIEKETGDIITRFENAVDKVASEMLGWGLQRTMTIAEGGEKCDFRFRKGGETSVPIPQSLM